MSGAVEMLEWIRDGVVNAKAAPSLPQEKVAGKKLIGELYNAPAPEYSADYDELIARVQRTYDKFQGGLYGCASNSD
jgi:2-oxoglutarate ferredoxin oxidoreductase subunit beta